MNTPQPPTHYHDPYTFTWNGRVVQIRPFKTTAYSVHVDDVRIMMAAATRHEAVLTAQAHIIDAQLCALLVDGKLPLMHKDEQLVEVVWTGQDSEWQATCWSDSHRRNIDYYFMVDADTGVVEQNTWEQSAMSECPQCEREWSDAHPHPLSAH
jgi:hypothetical protein